MKGREGQPTPLATSGAESDGLKIRYPVEVEAITYSQRFYLECIFGGHLQRC